MQLAMLKKLGNQLTLRKRQLHSYSYMLVSFRNGLPLAWNHARKRPVDHVTHWDGTSFYHPPGQGGLAEGILDLWVQQVYTRDFYQPKSGDVVIDAGANVGLFCVWLAKRFPDCRILAFEPATENFNVLQKNISASGVASIATYQAGLGAGDGFFALRRSGDRSYDFQVSLEPTDEHASDAIRLFSLASAIKEAKADRIALVKCDIEGSECELFGAATNDDLQRVERFAVEYHDNLRPGALKLLQERLASSHTLQVDPAGNEGYGMFYARRKDLRE
jgi:FkbM family methyltransferase